MNPNDPLYFDYAAAAPPYEEALHYFTEIAASYYANPSSRHAWGGSCREKLMEFKNQFCGALGFPDGRLLLCASGTEANNTIVRGYLNMDPKGGILIAENVHDSIWFAAGLYSDRTEILTIDRYGIIDIDQLRKALQKKPSLVCISHACNETGSLQPVQEVAYLCHHHDVPLLVDGAQAIGHIPVILDEIPCAYYTFSAHKFGAPIGTGGAFIRDDKFGSLVHGGRQEWDLRAGTENLPGLAASLRALKIANADMPDESMRLNELKAGLLSELNDSGIRYLENNAKDSLPGFLSISFPGLSGNEIVTALSLSGYSVSTGSACHANTIEPPRVILAMGRTVAEATGTIRITMGRNTTKKAVQGLRDAIIEFVNP